MMKTSLSGKCLFKINNMKVKYHGKFPKYRRCYFKNISKCLLKALFIAV